MTMPGSCHFAQELSRLLPEIKIIALAVPENAENVMECAEAGIAGYVAREASLEELINTVIGTQKGDFYCPPRIAECVFETVKRIKKNIDVQPLSPGAGNNRARKNRYFTNRDDLAAVLTRREQQIYDLMLEGLSNKKISHRLVIEVSTVKNHVHNILVKLDVKSRAQAVMLANRHQIVNLSERKWPVSSLS